MVASNKTSTQIVMLGTGTPRPDPDRCGPAVAIIVKQTPYLVDFGAGVVRRVNAAFLRGIAAFGSGGVNIEKAFLTHLHSDHTIGYPDLILTPWVMGREKPLEVYGPKGTASMTESILKAWQVDIEARVGGINQHNPRGCRVNVHEIAPGVVYENADLTVTAFAVRHEEMRDSFGFRFDTGDRRIVLSGDTAPTRTLIEHARGCDVLIHEAYSMATYCKVSARAQAFRQTHHTSSDELAQIANEVRPALLVIYHRSNVGAGVTTHDDEDILIQEIRSQYTGSVVAAHDLDIF